MTSLSIRHQTSSNQGSLISSRGSSDGDDHNGASAAAVSPASEEEADLKQGRAPRRPLCSYGISHNNTLAETEMCVGSRRRRLEDTNIPNNTKYSPHHHITTSPHHHIMTTSPHRNIATSPYHHITTSHHHHITTSQHRHIITSPHHITVSFTSPYHSRIVTLHWSTHIITSPHHMSASTFQHYTDEHGISCIDCCDTLTTTLTVTLTVMLLDFPFGYVMCRPSLRCYFAFLETSPLPSTIKSMTKNSKIDG